MEITEEREGFRVLLTDETNEGADGEYDPNDPEDYVRVRFYIDKADPEGTQGWSEVEHGSYCTGLRADSDPALLKRAATYIMDDLLPSLKEGTSIRYLTNDLSWMDNSWFE